MPSVSLLVTVAPLRGWPLSASPRYSSGSTPKPPVGCGEVLRRTATLLSGILDLAAALGLLGALDEAHAAVKAGLALDPTFTIQRVLATRLSDNPTYLAGRERICEGMRLAGVPEG